MLSHTLFNRLFRLSAWYDIAVTWPYATPVTLGLIWQALNAAHQGAGLPQLPALTVHGTLFANFLGTVVLIWSAARLWLGDPTLARLDALGRRLFSAWMLNALMNGASPLLWGFLMIEVAFAVLQSLPVRKPLSP